MFLICSPICLPLSHRSQAERFEENIKGVEQADHHAKRNIRFDRWQEFIVLSC